MSPATIDAVQAFAQFSGGALIGFFASILTTYVNARIQLMEAVLTEAEKQERKRPRSRWWSADRILPAVVIIVMVALLLAGLSWIKAGQEQADNQRRDCLRSVQVSQVLQARTNNYLESARSERQLWLDLRRQLRRMGAGPRSSLVQSIDRHLIDQRTYLRHLRKNPYATESAKDC